jgi:biotin synthase
MINDQLNELLNKHHISGDDIKWMLMLRNEEQQALIELAGNIKKEYVGNIVYYRGLIEYSNKCSKNCYYCGVRAGNNKVVRYEMTDEEVIEAAQFAYENKYGSIVIQAGERSDKAYTKKIAQLLNKIHQATNNKLRITLSLGEQDEDTYRLWKDNGAERYLLRIETSSEELYKKLHPNDQHHRFSDRMKSLELLKKLGYQLGSGVMIGLPFQTIDDLVGDLVFLRHMDIDMVGMGPYIEHEDTPLYTHKTYLLSKQERFNLSLKMVATLRIMMKDINIAATTAMQTLDPLGREKAITAGANVIMPNLTPVKYRRNYLLYEDKPCLDEDAAHCAFCLEGRIKSTGNEIGYDQWGDSKHFKNKNKHMER